MFRPTKSKITENVTIKYHRITVFVSQYISINSNQGTIDGAGQAMCDKDDKFDSNFGIELAGVRAEINMLKKYEEILIKMTKQPEWRKEKPDLNCKCEWTPEKVHEFNSSGNFMTYQEHEKYHKRYLKDK